MDLNSVSSLRLFVSTSIFISKSDDDIYLIDNKPTSDNAGSRTSGQANAQRLVIVMDVQISMSIRCGRGIVLGCSSPR
jgi:hypothetical protein